MTTYAVDIYQKDAHMDNIKQILASNLSREERNEIIRYLQRCSSFDIIGKLPIQLSTRILSFLTPEELCRLRIVSRSWNKLLTHDNLWRRICIEYSIIPDTMEASFPSFNHLRIYFDLFRRALTMTKTWKTFQCKRFEMRYHTGPVLSLLISHITRVFSGDIDGKIHVWDAQNRRYVHCIHAHTSHVSCLAHNGHHIASGSSDRSIQVHSIFNLAHVVRLEGHEGPVTALTYANDSILISGSVDRLIRVWNTDDATCLRILHGQENTIQALAFCPQLPLKYCQNEQDAAIARSNKAGFIVSGSSDHSVFVWDLKTSIEHDRPEVIASIMETNGPVTALTVYDELGEDEEQGWKKEQSSKHHINDYVTARKPINMPTFVAYAAVSDTGISIFSLPGLEKTQAESPNVHLGTIWSISTATLHSKLITTSSDRTAIVWDLKSSRKSITLGGFGSAVLSSAISPQEEILCFGTEKGHIILFDLQEFE
ncbi:WD40-repeat-containing domain protein [Choanephora cucurbitarum]|nr:WD40-repeat-containing domain protein [Choanephora cucurbitarum]